MPLPDEAASGERVQGEEAPGGRRVSAGGGPAGAGRRIDTTVSRPPGCRPCARPGPASRSPSISTESTYLLARVRRFRSTVSGHLCQRGWVNSRSCGAALSGIAMQGEAQMEPRAHVPCSRPSSRDFEVVATAFQIVLLSRSACPFPGGLGPVARLVVMPRAFKNRLSSADMSLEPLSEWLYEVPLNKANRSVRHFTAVFKVVSALGAAEGNLGCPSTIVSMHSLSISVGRGPL